MNDSFSTKHFIRTFSHREVVTSFSLALLLLSLFYIVDYYREVDWDERVVKWILFVITLPVNHIIYKAEHHRSNNFIGRSFHDYIFAIIFIPLYMIVRYTVHGVVFSFDGSLIILIPGSVIILAFIIACFELVIALLKRMLNFFKWQII